MQKNLQSKRVAIYTLALCFLFIVFYTQRMDGPVDLTGAIEKNFVDKAALSIQKPSDSVVPIIPDSVVGHSCANYSCSHCSSSEEKNGLPEQQLVAKTMPGADKYFQVLADLPRAKRFADLSIYTVLSECTKGQHVQLELGPLLFEGIAGVRKVAPGASSYVMELNGDAPGRLLIHRDGNGDYAGQVFFYGDSRVIEILPEQTKEESGQLKLQRNTVSGVLCAPPGTVFTTNVIRLLEGKF